jgi:hypothetical protein
LEKLNVITPDSNEWLKETLKIYKTVTEKGV